MLTRSVAQDLKIATAALAIVALWVAILIPAACWIGFCRLLELFARDRR